MEHLKNVHECTDTSDCLELSWTSGLYLKPIARLSITVTLPQLKSGQSISNWEVMEKLRSAILPETFTIIKVTKSTLEFLRLDAEIENKKNLPRVISKIDQKGIKLSGFSNLLKIQATEAKVAFPSRHDWDMYFRDAKHMNEMKPGERPDTVHFQGLPCSWFAHLGDADQSRPSEYVLSQVMSSYGEVRVVDIPILDSYRKQMSASINGIKTFSFGQDQIFEAYVQFKEYIGFAKCMHALQGKKLVFIEKSKKAWSTNIVVDFDRTKHLSEYSIKKRVAEREKLINIEREKEEKQRRKKEMEEMKLEAERLKLEEEQRIKDQRKEAKRKEKEDRRKTREENRRKKILVKAEEKKKQREEQEESRIARKIAEEERKLIIAQRKLESIRLLDELFERIKLVKHKAAAKKREAEIFKHARNTEGTSKREGKESRMQETLAKKERLLRDKLVRSYKLKEEGRMEQQREKMRKAEQGEIQLHGRGSSASLSLVSSATSESNSDDSNSDSDSSQSSSSAGTLNVPKIATGHMRMDHMDKEDIMDDYGNWQQQRPHESQQFPSYYDAYDGQEAPNFYEWGQGNMLDQGRGRGRGRWRFPRGPWRGRGFRDRGRGFRDRGRGFRGSWQHNYRDERGGMKSRDMKPVKPTTSWYKRGSDNDYSSSRSRSRSRSRRSRSRRSRSRSRSRRSRSRRSRSRRSRSHSRSRSRSRSKSRKSRSKSRSRSKNARSRSRSRKSRSKSRPRKSRSKSSRRSRSRSKSRSHSKSRSKSRNRSRSKSRHKSRSRSRSRSRHKRSNSGDRSGHSSERRRYKHRSERNRNNRKDKKDDKDVDDMRESDLELSSDPDGEYRHDDGYYEEEYGNYDDGSGSRQNYYPRGSAFGNFRGFKRDFQGRWPRGWRGRGRGWHYPSYYDYHEPSDDWNQGNIEVKSQYQDMYHKYFSSVAEREAAKKDAQRHDQSYIRDEEGREKEKYERGEYSNREGSHRDMGKDGSYTREGHQEDYHPSQSEFSDRRTVGREKDHSNWRGEFPDKERREMDDEMNQNERRGFDRERMKFSQEGREVENEKFRGISDPEMRRHFGSDMLRDHARHDSREHVRDNIRHYKDGCEIMRKDHLMRESENVRKDHLMRERGRSNDLGDSDRKVVNYGVTEKTGFERESSHGERSDNNDLRWKSRTLRADIEKRDVSVKDRLSFGSVKRPTINDQNEDRLAFVAGSTKSGKQRQIEHSGGRGRRNIDSGDLRGDDNRGRRYIESSDSRNDDGREWQNVEIAVSRSDKTRMRRNIGISDFRNNAIRGRHNIQSSSSRQRHDAEHSDRDRREDKPSENRPKHNVYVETRNRHDMRRGNDVRDKIKIEPSSDGERQDERNEVRKRNYEPMREEQNSESDDSDDDSEPHRKSHHSESGRKRRKDRKKDRSDRSDGRKHKHRKKKKKRSKN